MSLSKVTAFTCCIQCMCTHTGLCCAVFFYSGLCCHKIHLSHTRLHLAVNLPDCFMAQRQIASQLKTGSRYCSLSVYTGWASNTRKPSRCLFVSLWQTAKLSWRKLNREKHPYSFRWAVCLISHVWPIKTHSCSFSHLFEAALYYRLFACDVSFSQCITGLLICSHQPSCCLIYPHPSPVLMFFHCGILNWTIRQQKQLFRTTGNVILKQDCATFESGSNASYKWKN